MYSLLLMCSSSFLIEIKQIISMNRKINTRKINRHLCDLINDYWISLTVAIKQSYNRDWKKVIFFPPVIIIAQKMKFSIKDFFSKCDQIPNCWCLLQCMLACIVSISKSSTRRFWKNLFWSISQNCQTLFVSKTAG